MSAAGTGPERLPGAVFLSYASQDAAAAARLCAALRGGGIEVWFDQSELRGGDVWDQTIRQRIRDCALFIAVISAHTDERGEGYFRREWRLAVERSRDMADDEPFLLPVVIDATPEATARVPERFREHQWSRLPGGETPPAFVERVRGLLSPGAAPGVAAPREAPRESQREAPREAPRAAIPARTGPVRPSRARRLAPGLGLAVVAAALAGYVLLGRHPRLPVAAPVPPAPPTGDVAAGGAAETSIAVLPFTNESGDPSQQYFSDGIAEDLITALSQFPGLKVIGRTSSFTFRDTHEDSRTIGTKLGVTRLVEGSVRRAGDTVRVSAELIGTEDGRTLWSERYDRPYRNLFALQDEVTRAVAGALHSRLAGGAAADVQGERPASGNLDAYSALLQGKFAFSRFSEADLRKAIESFATATRLDPNYALAWSFLSQSWTLLGAWFQGGAELHASALEARKAADTALSLAPQLSAAHLARGLLMLNIELEFREASVELQRALELAPGSGDAMFSRGFSYMSLGQVDRGLEHARQALALDPLRARWHSWFAQWLVGAGRLDEGEKEARRSLELGGGAEVDQTTLTIIAVRRGDARAARAAAEQVSPGVWRDTAMAMATQIGNDRAAADAALTTLRERDAEAAAYQVAEVYAIRNDADNTFAWLERAWTHRDGGIALLLFDPFILRYQADPRFAAFCRKVGLPMPGEGGTAG